MSTSFSPDGSVLATSGSEGATALWDIGSRKQIGAPLTGPPKPGGGGLRSDRTHTGHRLPGRHRPAVGHRPRLLASTGLRRRRPPPPHPAGVAGLPPGPALPAILWNPVTSRAVRLPNRSRAAARAVGRLIITSAAGTSACPGATLQAPPPVASLAVRWATDRPPRGDPRRNALIDPCAAQVTRMARAETGKQAGQSGDADQGEIGTQTSSLTDIRACRDLKRFARSGDSSPGCGGPSRPAQRATGRV
jgi:hypothetical protein